MSQNKGAPGSFLDRGHVGVSLSGLSERSQYYTKSVHPAMPPRLGPATKLARGAFAHGTGQSPAENNASSPVQARVASVGHMSWAGAGLNVRVRKKTGQAQSDGSAPASRPPRTPFDWGIGGAFAQALTNQQT